jgi:hypothetical protein
MLPMHWGLFQLAPHAWTEPIERALVAADAARTVIVTPRPGGSIEPEAPPASARWWPSVPWVDAAKDPIKSTKVD